MLLLPMDLELSFWNAVLVLIVAGLLAWFAYYLALAWSLAIVAGLLVVAAIILYVVIRRWAHRAIRGKTKTGGRGGGRYDRGGDK